MCNSWCQQLVLVMPVPGPELGSLCTGMCIRAAHAGCAAAWLAAAWLLQHEPLAERKGQQCMALGARMCEVGWSVLADGA